MCGRFGSVKPPWDLAKRLGAKRATATAFMPRFNIAPTQPVLAILNDDEKTVRALRWGLIPSWSSDSAAKKMLSFNARIESLATSPAYRPAFYSRRCAIFADGYYEWRKNEDGTKTPLWISQRSGDPFVFAGIWDRWRSRETGERVESCTIVTQPPNAFVAGIHSRMPVVLADDAVPVWLASGTREPGELMEALQPTPGEQWTAYAVSPRVGNVRNDDAALLDPV